MSCDDRSNGEPSGLPIFVLLITSSLGPTPSPRRSKDREDDKYDVDAQVNVREGSVIRLSPFRLGEFVSVGDSLETKTCRRWVGCVVSFLTDVYSVFRSLGFLNLRFILANSGVY